LKNKLPQYILVILSIVVCFFPCFPAIFSLSPGRFTIVERIDLRHRSFRAAQVGRCRQDQQGQGTAPQRCSATFNVGRWPKKGPWKSWKPGNIYGFGDENRVYSQTNSHLIGIMISKTIGFRGTLFSDTPILILFRNIMTPSILMKHPCSPSFLLLLRVPLTLPGVVQDT
jgi:hypothetical protein